MRDKRSDGDEDGWTVAGRLEDRLSAKETSSMREKEGLEWSRRGEGRGGGDREGGVEGRRGGDGRDRG